MVFLLAIAGGLFASQVSAKAEAPVSSESESLTWLLPSKGASASGILFDKRFDHLLARSVPKISIYLGMSKSKAPPPPLRSSVWEVMGGPDQSLVETDGRYVMLSSCRLHSCDEKGFVWIDTAQGAVIGGVVHFFYGAESGRSLLLWSNKQIESLPEPFLRDFSQWNRQWLSVAADVEKAIAPSLPVAENGYARVRLVEPDQRIWPLSPTYQLVHDGAD
ncbi:hypothetical protein ISN76_19130 [Dyella halodurans]|uniref:hypothetical protein n=1 Tax=Dyella halodurans TaxID=1920171 RepID=UPI00225C1D7B|nr:hypothetical protein [Dyella halodurans]